MKLKKKYRTLITCLEHELNRVLSSLFSITLSHLLTDFKFSWQLLFWGLFSEYYLTIHVLLFVILLSYCSSLMARISLSVTVFSFLFTGLPIYRPNPHLAQTWLNFNSPVLEWQIYLKYISWQKWAWALLPLSLF